MQNTIKNVASLGLREYKNPTKIIKLTKDVKTQMLEMEGKIEFDKGNYHNTYYENMIKNIVKSRQEYRNSSSVQEKQNIANQEIKLWSDYIAKRKEDIPDELKITEKQIYQIKQIWDLVKNRKERGLSSDLILEFHNEYAKKFKFDILIDPKCLVQMIHPHHGYLNLLPGQYELEQLLNIYNQKLVATHERQLGQDLLADEISSFVYWNQFDKENKGYMNNNEFFSFLKVFKFDIESVDQFSKEFSFALNLHPGEFDIKQQEGIHRFDFFRYLFLERNL